MDLAVDPTSSVAPFEQLRSQVAAQVADGRLPAGSRLATVRQLAADLGLAPGTVARAYRELEADGVVATHGRRGTFVSSRVLDGEPVDGNSPAADHAAAYVDQARRAGLTLPEALTLVERSWGR